MRWLPVVLTCTGLLLQGCVGKLPTHPEWMTLLQRAPASETPVRTGQLIGRPPQHALLACR